MKASLVIFGCALLVSTTAQAHADEGAAYELRVGGASLGSVRSINGGDPDKTVTIAATDISPALVAELRAFFEGKVAQKSLSLHSGAVVKRANEARLSSVKLPVVGTGAGVSPPEVDLAFDVGSLKTSPSLSAASDKRRSAAKISGFHLRVDGLSANVNRVDAILVKGGATTLPPVGFVIDSADAPSFQTWQKAKTTRRDVNIEYTNDKGEALLKVTLQGCLPAVTPNGPIMQVVVSCSKIKMN